MEVSLIIEQFIDYMNSGGFVMWPLFIAIMFLWFGLGYRFHALNRGTKKSVRTLIRKYDEKKRKKVKGMIDSAVVEAMDVIKTHGSSKKSRDIIEDLFYPRIQEINRYRVLVMTIVAAAPLIGLLGTVIGMIETFDSLASASLFSQSGGIAGGISQALFTTQLGLVVAVPGLVVGKLLDRKAETMEIDLEQITDILCSQGVMNEN